jgi:hypothetical protein
MKMAHDKESGASEEWDKIKELIGLAGEKMI